MARSCITAPDAGVARRTPSNPARRSCRGPAQSRTTCTFMEHPVYLQHPLFALFKSATRLTQAVVLARPFIELARDLMFMPIVNLVGLTNAEVTWEVRGPEHVLRWACCAGPCRSRFAANGMLLRVYEDTLSAHLHDGLRCFLGSETLLRAVIHIVLQITSWIRAAPFPLGRM